MEDDNALDIIKWLFKETKSDVSGLLSRDFDGAVTKWEAKLRGNLLAMKPVDVAAVPVLYVCEKIHVHEDETNSCSFHLKYGDEELRLTADSKVEADKWLLKLATCSHQMVQAELDQIMQKYYAETTRSNPTSTQTIDSSSLSSFFLTAPFEKDKSFFIYQSVGIPNRVVVCKELMCESKLSMVIPPEMLKLFVRWASELRNELLARLATIQNVVILESLQNAVRHLNSNIEVYTEGVEFLDGYVGPCFRPSIQRYRMTFAAVPTNLHAQYFLINNRPAANFLTCGATIVAPLRFAGGGLYKMRNKFIAEVDPQSLDSITESRFYTRKQTLLNVKREIGELTKRIDCDWHIAQFGTVDKVGVEIFAKLKQLHETVCDIIQSFPNISNLVDGLSSASLAQLTTNTIPDKLFNQLDNMDAMMISLNSKMVAIDIINDDPRERENFETSAKVALNAALDSLHQLVDSLLVGQLVGLIISLRLPINCQSFFNIQLRHDLLLSQAITIVTTALLTLLHDFLKTETTPTHHQVTSITAPLISCFSFLSCHGDERGMMEDMFEIWSSFGNSVQFRYVEANSAVSETCIPQIEGYRTDLRISLPLPSEFYSKLFRMMNDTKLEWFRVETIFWNVGVNHEATLACSLGDISLEENINRTALNRVQNYVQKFCDDVQSFVEKDNTPKTESSEDQQDDVSGGESPLSPKDGLMSVCALFSELKETINECPSKKNMNIFYKVVALTNAMKGINILSCKSGKDRTAMAVTLAEGLALKDSCGISQNQMSEIIDFLRRDGVRRENCRKNVNKAIYSFSPFQMHFLPKELRPPNGTYASKVSS